MPKSILVLIPTLTELKQLKPTLDFVDDHRVQIAVCGFGPVAAAARAAALIDQHNPNHVFVAGTAGSLDPSLTVGQAIAFSDVTIDGIGAGTGDAFESAEQMGWDFLDDDHHSIGSELPLVGTSREALLVTVCSASASDTEAGLRRERFPNAIAEDMETFAVAFAAASAQIPLTAIRGISNVAGQRDKTNWKLDQALLDVSKALNANIKKHFETRK
jgi:futalosine hydrolase